MSAACVYLTVTTATPIILLEVQNKMSDEDMPRGQPRAATNEEILNALIECDEIVFGHNDVAEEFGVTAQTARNRMSEMAEQNLLKRRDIGGTWVYWIDCMR